MLQKDSPQIQVRFVTKTERLKVPDQPVSTPTTLGRAGLNEIVNKLGKKSGDAILQFEFFIDGRQLKTTVQEHVNEHSIATESVLSIEYCAQIEAPQPDVSLLHDDWVSSVDGSRDGLVLSGCYDNRAYVWSLAGERLATIIGHSEPLKCVAWIEGDAPSDVENSVRRLLTGSQDQSILQWLWDRDEGTYKNVFCYKGHCRSVDALAVRSPLFASGSWDGSIKVWSLDEEEDCKASKRNPPKKKKRMEGASQIRTPLVTFASHKEAVSSVCWTDKSVVATASFDKTIRLFDLNQSECSQIMNSPKAILSHRFSPLNGLFVTGSADKYVRMFDPRSSEGSVVKATFVSHDGWVSGVSWSPSDANVFLSGSYDKTAKMWDVRSLKSSLYDLSGHNDKILGVDWSTPESIITGGADSHVRMFKHT